MESPEVESEPNLPCKATEVGGYDINTKTYTVTAWPRGIDREDKFLLLFVNTTSCGSLRLTNSSSQPSLHSIVWHWISSAVINCFPHLQSPMPLNRNNLGKHLLVIWNVNYPGTKHLLREVQEPGQQDWMGWSLGHMEHRHLSMRFLVSLPFDCEHYK